MKTLKKEFFSAGQITSVVNRFGWTFVFKCRIYILCLTLTSAQQRRYIGFTEGVLRRFFGEQKVRGTASVEFDY